MSDVNLLADIVQTLYFRLRYQPIFIIIFIGGKKQLQFLQNNHRTTVHRCYGAFLL